MKVFLSMPMHGRSDEEILRDREKFFKLIKKLDAFKDAELIDNFTKPAEITDSRIKMLGDSIMKMAEADVAVFVSGWRQSNGCDVEHRVCERYNIPRYFLRAQDKTGERYLCEGPFGRHVDTRVFPLTSDMLKEE